MTEKINTLSIVIGPTALIFSTQEQRNEIYDIWLRGEGIRAWADQEAHGTKIFFETKNVKGHIRSDGEVVYA
jgi:hypothetical protein